MTSIKSSEILHGVFLDLDTYAPDRLDLSAFKATLPDWTFYNRTAPEDVLPRIKDAQVAVLNKVVLDRPILEEAEALKLIVVGATGVNNIDLKAAKELGIRVCNIRGYSTPSVVQHVFAMILALATQLIKYNEDVHAGAWQRSPDFCILDYPVMELSGKTIGIVGYGDLGRAVEQVAKAFDMKPLIAERIGADGLRPGRLPFSDVLEQADILTLHCPLSDETRGLIGPKELARMKPSAFLINAARGGVVDEEALAEALRQGTIAGAGVDVLSKEPPTSGNPLLAPDIPNLIITPHTAWGSVEAIQRLFDQVTDIIYAFKDGKPFNVLA